MKLNVPILICEHIKKNQYNYIINNKIYNVIFIICLNTNNTILVKQINNSISLNDLK